MWYNTPVSAGDDTRWAFHASGVSFTLTRTTQETEYEVEVTPQTSLEVKITSLCLPVSTSLSPREDCSKRDALSYVDEHFTYCEATSDSETDSGTLDSDFGTQGEDDDGDDGEYEGVLQS